MRRACVAAAGEPLAVKGIDLPLPGEESEGVGAAAVRQIGVNVDHGETSCTTPDAVSYIQKAAQRKYCP